jgi:hypothetical protein
MYNHFWVISGFSAQEWHLFVLILTHPIFQLKVHPIFGLCLFLSLAKIRMNQICSTLISNQKRMSKGIPLLVL